MPSPRNYSRQEVDAIYERVRLIDPDLVAAAEEQDSELIHWYSSLEPKQRLRRGCELARHSNGYEMPGSPEPPSRPASWTSSSKP